MGFWEEHERAEAERATSVAAKARLPQNAPMTCASCGHHGTDVLLGVCGACAEGP